MPEVWKHKVRNDQEIEMSKDELSKRLEALEGKDHGTRIHVIRESDYPTPEDCDKAIAEIERTADPKDIILRVVPAY